MGTKKSLRIGEVARATGLATSAIRYYERQGLLPRAGRVGGQRVFDGDVVDRLAVIRFAKSAGFSLAEVQTLLRGFASKTPPGPRWRALAERKVAELDRRLEETRRMKTVLEVATGCACPSFEDCARAIEEAAP